MVEDVSSLLDGVHQGGQVSAQASIPKDRGPTGSQALLPLLTDQRREEENGDDSAVGRFGPLLPRLGNLAGRRRPGRNSRRGTGRPANPPGKERLGTN